MPNDIGLDLYEQIKALFDKKCEADGYIRGVADKVAIGTATMQDISLYSKQLGFRLRQAIGETVTADVLPDGQMHFNIAEKILSPLLHDNYDLINDVAADVQKKLDAAKGIKIKPQKAPFPADRLKTVLNAASEPGLDEATMQRRMSVPAETITQSFADDYMQTNARFRNRAGIQAYIVRKDDGKCCDWCAKLAGRYSYPEGTPNDVFRRHDNCGCTVTYESGDMRQNAWTKRTWQASPEELAERRELEEKLKPVRFTPEQAAAKEGEVLEQKKAKTSQMSSDFVPAKSIEEAEKFALENGVRHVNYSDLPLETANLLNEAAMTLPEDIRPAYIGSGKSVQKVTGQKFSRKEKDYYGVHMDVLQMHFGEYPNIEYDFEGGNVVGISTAYKTPEKIHKSKVGGNKAYAEKHDGHTQFFNTDGRSTAFHEMGHVYADKKGIPEGFAADAERWFKESKCDMLKSTDEAWAEAWGAYHTKNPDLPDYISRYISSATNGNLTYEKSSSIIEPKIQFDGKKYKKKSSDFKTIHLSASEREHLFSEIATNLSEEQKSSEVFIKYCGDYQYIVENHGFGNYRVISRRKIK